MTHSSAENEPATPDNLNACLLQASPEQQEAGESYAPEQLDPRKVAHPENTVKIKDKKFKKKAELLRLSGPPSP